MERAPTPCTPAITPAFGGAAFDDVDREIAANLKAEARALVAATLERRIGGVVLDLAGDWEPTPLTPAEVERRRRWAAGGAAPAAALPGPALTPFPTIAGLFLGYRPGDGASTLFINPDDPRGAAQPAVRVVVADLERQIDVAMRLRTRPDGYPRLLTAEQVAALRLPPEATAVALRR